MAHMAENEYVNVCVCAARECALHRAESEWVSVYIACALCINYNGTPK